MNNGLNFSQFTQKLSRRIFSYQSTYADAKNFNHFKYELNSEGKKVLRSAFTELFGAAALENLNPKKEKFLGIDVFQIDSGNVEPV